MTEPALTPIQVVAPGVHGPVPGPPARVALDGRHPRPLHQREHILQVVAGHVDVFAVTGVNGVDGARRHLFRVESGGVVLGFPEPPEEGPAGRLQVVAVGGPGTEALLVPRREIADPEVVTEWIVRLGRIIAGPNPSWEMREAPEDGPTELAAGERRRGPARKIVWVSVQQGSVNLMGGEPACGVGTAPVPLTSGMWVEAGRSTSMIVASGCMPAGDLLWSSLDQFHHCAVVSIRDRIAADDGREAQRLAHRVELAGMQTVELFDRLSGVVAAQAKDEQVEAEAEDPLLGACRVVAAAIRTSVARPPGRIADGRVFQDVVEIARASRLRVRRVLLRAEWWTKDVGPLVAWHGEERRPVALVRAGRGYELIDGQTGSRRKLTASVALELSPEAATFYPVLPSRALGFGDLLTYSVRHSSGNLARIVLSVLVTGLLSLVAPLVIQALVTSVIPRTELDQLAFCALALAVSAFAAAGMQTMAGFALLRLEGLIDWKLQAAVIDRLLRLPASLFRAYTVGEFVDRSMGIDTVRRVMTGRTLRSLMTGTFCWFSVGLMFYYDVKLALVAIVLIAVRGFVIVAASALRLYHENRHSNLQGKIGGLVLQLLAAIGKLRVAAATPRALAVWARQFAAQKRHFVASQYVANALNAFESAFLPVSTLLIFAVAASQGSKLIADLGAFLAFFAAFGQSMTAIGAWATGVSESLIAIPHLTRVRPLIAEAGEVAEDRKSPGALSGAVEFSRLTFRYLANGPPVLDNVSVRIAPGEYVAIVGPSGSGKSSLFRLLLGFERPESGAVFLDGKALDTLDISAVRRQLGVVLQNGKLATGSIYDNICGGMPLPLEQVWEAARLAGLESDIKSMPMGMHTAIAEGVNTLSGGQRQRLMIARAIARRPRIVLFDEATSSLDNKSQAVVSTSLGNLNVTRIVIAHRLSTVRDADRIIVLVDGKVVQSGTFAQLNAVPGMFADLMRRQLL